MYDTRGARYVAVRSNGYHSGSSAKYVAVRNGNGYDKLRRARYTAIQDVDLDSVRYVALRNNATNRTRYLAVRSGYRRGNGIVGYVDFDDEPRQVVVRRVVPRTRYVAVRDIDMDDYDEPRYVAVRRVAPRTKYVAVRNINSGCTRAVALRSCLDDVETTSVRRVVFRDDDDGYRVRTKHVVLEDEDDDEAYVIQHEVDDDDDEYISVVNDSPKYIEYTPAAYSNGNGATYIAANNFDNTCVRNIAVRTCRPDAVSSRTIAYEVSDDDDLDDQAFIHDDGVTYVAANDMEDACLPGRVVGTSTRFVTTRAVESVPEEYVDEDVSLLRKEPAYVETATDNAAVPWPRWVALDEDRTFNDLDPTWVAEVEDTCETQGVHCNLADQVAAGTVNFVPADDEFTTATVSYVPVDNTAVETVSYVPAGDVDTSKVSYVPVEAVEATEVSYIPVDDVDEAEVSYLPVDDVTTSEVSYLPVDDVENVDKETVSFLPVSDVDTETVAYVPVDQMRSHAVSYVPVDEVHAQTVSYVPIDQVDTTYVAADECPMLVSSVDAEPVHVDDASAVNVEEVDDDLVAYAPHSREMADGLEDGGDVSLETTDSL
jgi:hypothetical protein